MIFAMSYDAVSKLSALLDARCCYLGNSRRQDQSVVVIMDHDHDTDERR